MENFLQTILNYFYEDDYVVKKRNQEWNGHCLHIFLKALKYISQRFEKSLGIFFCCVGFNRNYPSRCILRFNS